MRYQQTGRIIAGFVISPGASAVTMIALLSVISRAFPSVGYAVTVALLVYGCAIVLGVPIFLLSRSWNLHTLLFYSAAALAIAAPLICLAIMLTHGIALPAVATVAAICGGLVFRAIVEHRPNSEVNR